MLKGMIKSRMNVQCLNYSYGTHEHNAEIVTNQCTAMESITSDSILYWPVAVALSTKGPEIQTELIHSLLPNTMTITPW
jgi:pyruvate kinase